MGNQAKLRTLIIRCIYWYSISFGQKPMFISS